MIEEEYNRDPVFGGHVTGYKLIMRTAGEGKQRQLETAPTEAELYPAYLDLLRAGARPAYQWSALERRLLLVYPGEADLYTLLLNRDGQK
jgi:hypothetical protein